MVWSRTIWGHNDDANACSEWVEEKVKAGIYRQCAVFHMVHILYVHDIVVTHWDLGTKNIAIRAG